MALTSEETDKAAKPGQWTREDRSVPTVTIPPTKYTFGTGDNERKQRDAYIVAVAEGLCFDCTRRIDRKAVAAANGFYPVVTKTDDAKKRPGLLELLNRLSPSFKLDELKKALDGSTSVGKAKNRLVVLPAARGKELEKLLEACQVAGRVLGLGSELSHEFSVHLAHPLGSCWRHWLWTSSDLIIRTSITDTSLAP